jgi:hypothetical protein
MPTSFCEHGQFSAADFRQQKMVLRSPSGRRSLRAPALRARAMMGVTLVALAICSTYAQAQSGADSAERARTSSAPQGGEQAAGTGKSTQGGASKGATAKSKKRDFKPSERIGVGPAVPFPVDI